MNVAELIREVEAEHPLAVRLAEAVSLAVVVDPVLLRRARLALVPEADPGTEADLWASPLVQTRSSDGLLFDSEMAHALRERLAAHPARLERAWNLTQQLHGHLASPLRLEEEIAWLSVSNAPGAAQRIEELLRSVLAALVIGERRGLAHWAARALPALPSKVRSLETARLLDAGARLRLGGDPRALQEEGMPDAAWIMPTDLPRVPVRVKLLEGVVELDARAAEGNVIQVPGTDPLLLELMWEEDGDETAVQVTLRRDEWIRIPVLSSSVRLRTLLGEVYDLRATGQPSGRLRNWIIDFSAERERHRPFFGREKEQKEILRLIRDSGRYGRLILVESRTGEGKTALLAHLIDRLAEEQSLEPIHHFFRRGTWAEDVEGAERSLRVQLAERFPELESIAFHFRLPELLIHLGATGFLKTDGEPLVIVLDAIDEAWSERPGEVLSALVPEQLPLQLVVLASVRTESREGIRLPEPVTEVPLGDPTAALLEYWNDFSASPIDWSNFGTAKVLRSWFESDWRRQL